MVQQLISQEILIGTESVKILTSYNSLNERMTRSQSDN